MGNENNSLSAGVPELMILRLLQDQEMYGYEIVQAIALRTGQAVTPGEGVVYPVLHGLQKDGALKSRRRNRRRAASNTPRAVSNSDTIQSS